MTAKRQASDTYKVRCACSNCGWEGELVYPKGKRAPTGVLGGGKAECPNCGCLSAMTSWERGA